MLRKCPDCSKEFRKKSTFVKHWRRKHDKSTMEWEKPAPRGKHKSKGK